jgi:ABC-type phosphate transport system auxiliary subunit
MEKDTWGEYSKLVLKELERLNENYDKLRSDMDAKFTELNQKLTEVKNIEGKVNSHATWIEKVNDVWSPTQMKEAKDEIYKQKTRWAATIAIISFIQVAIGIGIAIWGKLH